MSEPESQIAVADIGGTNTRFAIATIDGGTTRLSQSVVFKTAEFTSFQSAWKAFRATVSEIEIRTLGISFAGPIKNGQAKLTNGNWELTEGGLATALGMTRVCLINDLAAIARSIPEFAETSFEQICGPPRSLPRPGPVSVVGLGTGLGLALLLNVAPFHVIPCEGGHADFPPHDVKESDILSDLRARLDRVSWERIVSGGALRNLAQSNAKGRASSWSDIDDRSLWELALEKKDSEVADYINLIIANLGSAAGDFSLIQGSESVVLAGGLANRLKSQLSNGLFEERFIQKDRMTDRMKQISVHLLTRDDAGLVGSARWLGADVDS